MRSCGSFLPSPLAFNTSYEHFRVSTSSNDRWPLVLVLGRSSHEHMWASPLLNDHWVPSRVMLVCFFTLYDRRVFLRFLAIQVVAYFLLHAIVGFTLRDQVVVFFFMWDDCWVFLASCDRRVLASHPGRPYVALFPSMRFF